MTTNLTPEAKERVARLRKNVRVAPIVCVQKMKYATEAFRATEGASAEYRRAMALDNILTHLTVAIGDDELFVGRPTGHARGGPLDPEVNSSWYLKEMDHFHDREEERYTEMTEEDKAVVRDCVSYWQGKSLFDRWQAMIPAELKKYNGPVIGGGGFCLNTQYFGHILTDFGIMLQKGVVGLYKDIDESIAKLGSFADVDNFRKIEYLKAMKISLGALVKFANRYADEAERLASEEKNEKRKKELERIAATCRWVPEHPARDLYEAIQSTWFTVAAINNESWGVGPSLARVDQYLYPFYLSDKAKGVTDEEVLEMLTCFLIKQNGQFKVYSSPAAKLYGGLGCRFGNVIGGLKADGSTAVNELSYLFLDAARISALTEDFMVMTGENTPFEFMEKAIDTAAALHGKMKFLGCDVIVEQMLHDGRPLEMARNCGVTGCNSPGCMGQALDLPGGMVNLMLILDLVLHNGYSPTLGMKLGLETGDPRDFKTFDELFDAWKKQFSFFVPYIHLYKNLDKALFAEYLPCPLQSALMHGCIEKATDLTRGAMNPYVSYSVSVSGAPDMGDSLYALKKLIFEDKSVTMDEMIKALDDNWEGHDDIFHKVGRLPKFGNDEPCVDGIVNEVLAYCCREIEKYPGYLGAKSTIAAGTVTSNILMGADVGATPDGRHAGEPISEGGISPHQGRNISGVTATLSSVGRLDPLNFRHGSVLNIRIDPEAVETPDKIKKLATLVSSFHAMGGYLVQFNVVSTETLRDAQIHPEDHRDLLVRVSTYSAYFVELSKALQDDIIARLEFHSV